MLLYGAALTHIALAFLALYQRRHLRLPAADAWQLGLGLVLPVLLASHVVGTRVAHEMYGYEDSYSIVTLILWELRPEAGARQLLVIALAWIHGCLGLRASLRLRPWYPRAVYALFAVALLVPVLAALGFVQGGRQAAARARAAGGPAVVQLAAKAPPPAGGEVLDAIREGLLWAYGAALAGVIVARAGRSWRARRGGSVRLRYPDGREVHVAARLLGPRGEPVRRHPARVRLRRAGALLHLSHPRRARGARRSRRPPKRSSESSDASRRRRTCGSPVSSARCATWTSCPSCPPTRPSPDASRRAGPASGQEQEVAVLFADIRGFTRFAERRLPYDVVFFLNRYFETVGVAIEQVGGIANQFTGDGVMALFGVDGSPEEGCRQALGAAVLLHQGMAELGRSLGGELGGPLQIGVGIHVGPAVVGRMGYKTADYLTAVGRHGPRRQPPRAAHEGLRRGARDLGAGGAPRRARRDGLAAARADAAEPPRAPGRPRARGHRRLRADASPAGRANHGPGCPPAPAPAEAARAASRRGRRMLAAAALARARGGPASGRARRRAPAASRRRSGSRRGGPAAGAPPGPSCAPAGPSGRRSCRPR